MVDYLHNFAEVFNFRKVFVILILTLPTVAFANDYALDFDGSNDYIRVDLTLPTGNFSYTAWELVGLQAPADLLAKAGVKAPEPVAPPKEPRKPMSKGVRNDYYGRYCWSAAAVMALLRQACLILHQSPFLSLQHFLTNRLI